MVGTSVLDPFRTAILPRILLYQANQNRVPFDGVAMTAVIILPCAAERAQSGLA
jgi:hypothetical protein